MARQIIVDIIGDSSSYNRAIDKAVTKTRKGGNILKGLGVGIGFGAFGLLTAAVGGLTDVLGEANRAYQEDMASQAKLATALENTVDGWDGNTAGIEKLIAAQMKLGFSDDAQRDSLALLLGSTNDITKAQELQAAAFDLSRLRGIDLAAATDIMVKANEGNFRGLKAIGITLDANATSTEALAAVTAIAGGQAQAYADGPLGKQEAAQLQVGESMERIGLVMSNVSQAVLPVLADAFTFIVGVLGDVWAAIEPVLTILAKELGPVIAKIVGFITGSMIPALVKLTTIAFGGLAKILTAVASVVMPLVNAGFEALSKDIIPPILKGLELMGKGAKLLGDIFANLARGVTRAWNSILGAIKSVINTIIRGWNSIKFEIPHIDLGPLGRIGGFTIGTPNIPLMHSGGIVAGPAGSDQLIMAQAGERVIPAGEDGGDTIFNITFTGPIGGDQNNLLRQVQRARRTAHGMAGG